MSSQSSNLIIKNKQIIMHDIQNGLKFEDIPYEYYYKLSRASLGQILRAILETLNREWDKENPYLVVIMTGFNKSIPKLITEAKKLFDIYDDKKDPIYDYDIKKDYSTRYSNLAGRNGSIPKEIIINNDNNIRLGNSNMGPLINALFQRIKFIRERELPIYYINDPSYQPYFEKLKNNVHKFKLHLIEFQKSFNELKRSARIAGNVNMRKIYKNRKNKNKNTNTNIEHKK